MKKAKNLQGAKTVQQSRQAEKEKSRSPLV
jgi:hypothetical protein